MNLVDNITNYPGNPSDFLVPYNTVHGTTPPAKEYAERILFEDLAIRYANRHGGKLDLDLKKVTVHQQDNITIVVVDKMDGNQVVGWSKFNPGDYKIQEGQRKDGTYWWRKVSTYNPRIGVLKAMHRAVQQLVKL